VTLAAALRAALLLGADGGGLRIAGLRAEWSATTTVADTVYAADGSYAQGNLIITWPPFIRQVERRWRRDD